MSTDLTAMLAELDRQLRSSPADAIQTAAPTPEKQAADSTRAHSLLREIEHSLARAQS